jgi:plastocyanin
MTTSLVSMKRIPLLILAVLALTAAGCGSSSKSNSSSSSSSASAPATTTGAATGSGGAAKSGTVTIDMQNIAFNPASVTVKVGQTVKWVNKDDVAHNVTGGPLKSSTFNKGGSYEFTPKKAETISYVCTIHPGMKATLTVTS